MTALNLFAPCVGGVLPVLRVLDSAQQLRSTPGRLATDRYSWMQAVHWVVGAGCWSPCEGWRGPKELNLTTVRVAQLLAELSPCRPGVEFLMRRLGLSRRSVQYHLRMLREAGLLAYVEVGTRHRGIGARASEFALVIPVEFDVALGVRTVGEGTGRRMVGIAEAGRELMARLGVKASQKWRAARVKKKRTKASAQASAKATEVVDQGAESLLSRVSQGASDTSSEHQRCAPMEGGCSVCACAGPSLVPSESKLASGQPDLGTREQQHEQGRKAKRRVLNKVGRRHQLAFELVQQVPWLGAAAVPRIAWVARHVADAGWTVTEVIAWLEVAPNAGRIRRPSAYLAHRLRGAHLVWDTDAKRAAGVLTWRDSRRSAADRHMEWGGDWAAPSSMAVRRLVVAAQTQMAAGHQDAGATWHSEDDPLGDPLDLSRAEIVDLRTAAEKDHGLVRDAIASWGEDIARRVYSHRIVDLVQAAERADARSFRMVVHTSPWEGR